MERYPSGREGELRGQWVKPVTARTRTYFAYRIWPAPEPPELVSLAEELEG